MSSSSSTFSIYRSTPARSARHIVGGALGDTCGDVTAFSTFFGMSRTSLRLLLAKVVGDKFTGPVETSSEALPATTAEVCKGQWLRHQRCTRGTGRGWGSVRCSNVSSSSADVTKVLYCILLQRPEVALGHVNDRVLRSSYQSFGGLCL